MITEGKLFTTSTYVGGYMLDFSIFLGVSLLRIQIYITNLLCTLQIFWGVYSLSTRVLAFLSGKPLGNNLYH